jgi:hypothetical protein
MATVTASYNWVSGETVTPAKLNTTAAPTVVVADNEVTTAKILDANVTTAKLATSAVETAKIADDAVTNDKLSLAANAGEVKKALNADNPPPIFACRAWVRFDGTLDASGAASTANTNRRIIASGNVSSVLRAGKGTYTVTFTTAMPSVDYAAVVSARHDLGNTYACNADTSALTTTSVAIATGWQSPTTGGNTYDPTSVNLSVFA